ncbi:MAG: alpha/beta fold hydrolase [Hyphomonadaceae bacterium]
MPTATLNGHAHHWEDVGKGEPLVLIHGAAQSGVSLMDHAHELSATHRVIVPDLRGMGQSAHVDQLPPSAWVDDLKALLDHLGVKRAHIHGISLGSRVALRMAVDHPSYVQSLLLELPIIGMQADTNAALNMNLGNMDDLPAAEQARRQAMHGDNWRQVAVNYMKIRNQQDLQDYLNVRETAKDIKVPTLIFRGDAREIVHPLAHCFELHQKIAGSWLWIRPKTETAVMNTAPQESYAIIREFLATAR